MVLRSFVAVRFYLFMVILLSFTCSYGQILKREAKNLIEAKDYAKAESQLKEFIKSYPNDNEAIELLGDAYAYQEKWDLAIETYTTLTELSPENAELHYKLGGSLGMKALNVNKLTALILVGDIKAELKEAIRLEPSHIDARWALIELYMALPGILGGSSKTALHYANELDVLSPVDGFLAKGHIYKRNNQLKLAEENYLKAVKVGGSVVCFNELSDFYQGIKKPKKAITTLEEAQIKHNRNALHYQLGKVSANYNVELDKGLLYLTKYIKEYSSKDGIPIEWAYYRQAQIYRHKKDKQNALSNIQKALFIRNDFPQAKEEEKIILNL